MVEVMVAQKVFIVTNLSILKIFIIKYYLIKLKLKENRIFDIIYIFVMYNI